MKVQLARAWPCLVLLAALTACTQATNGNKQDAGPTQTACTLKDDCATGQVCAGGVCIQGDCETRDQCPKPRDQVCNEFFRCVPDPLSPIRDQCPNGDRDCNLGQFCSAGTCYSTSDRTACTRSSQCSNADRCDARAGYCVPNLGGCDRCNDYPELCCSSDESCSPETGRCQTNSHGGIPCTVATEATDCLGGTTCHDGYCAQCWIEAGTTADGGAIVRGCGPGTTCNTATGTCVSNGACESDADCSMYPGRRCAVATRQCTVPQCVSDSTCLTRERCNLETFQCYLPPAVCTEADEPNNAMSQATALSTMTASGGYSGSSILCRGDQDYLSFPIQSGRRVTVVTNVTPSLGAYGMTVALVGPNGGVLSESTLDSSGRRTLAANGMADGNAFLRIGSGSSTSNDQWNYTVDVTYSDPLLCDTEPGEPNETLASASQSVVVEGTFSRALCSATDKDNHLFHAGANKRVTVSLNFDSAVDFSFTLQTPTGSTLDSSSYSSPPVSLTTSTTAAQDMVLTVAYPAFSTPPTDASIYTVTITQTDPPMCAGGPPHHSAATALVVPPGTVTGVACDPDLDDWYKINLAQVSDIAASLSFPQSMDFDLVLYKSDGTTTVDTAASGSANPEEVLGTNLMPGAYYLKVIPYTSSPADYPASYELTITAPGYCVDDPLDDAGGNDTASSAVGLRDFVDGSLNYSADLNLCGGDEDWFRVVALGHERLSVVVTGVPDALATVYSSTASGLVELGRSRPTDLGGTTAQVFTSPIVVTAGLFYVRVNAGPATDGAYHLVVRTEPDPCDGLGGDTEPNDAPANAQLASSGVNRGIFCPRDDVDVWKFTGSTGDVISATLSFDGTEGDADLALWQPGQAMAMAKDDAVNADAASTATVGATLTQGGLYWLVVTRKGASLPVGQTYNLNAQGFTGASSSSSSGGAGSSSQGASSAAAPSSAMGASSSAADSSSAAADSSSAAAASSSAAADSSSAAASASSDPGVSSTDMSSSGGGSSAS